MDDTNPFFLIGNDECDMKNPSLGAVAEKHQIAGLYFFQRYFYPLEGLCAGARREGYIEIFHYKMGKARAVEAYFGVTAGISVRQPQVFLGICDKLFSELPLPLDICANQAGREHRTGLEGQEAGQQQPKWNF